MKVLKDNYNETKSIATVIVKPYPRTVICDECESELEYDKSDMHMGHCGCMHLTCPLCGYEIMLDDNEENITLTVDNVEFPTHFYHFNHTSNENSAVDCFNNKEIKSSIERAIKYFRENKNEFAYETGSGNLTVHIYRYENDEEYHIVVAGNYYSVEIPFEQEDY